jgi:hypothetical protein
MMKIRRILFHFLCIITGLFFIFSGYTKMISTEVLEYTLVNSFNAGWEIAPAAARLIIGAEYLLGAFLLFHLWLRRFTLPALLLMMCGFTIYIIWSVISGNEESCNCLGDFMQLSPWESLVKNIIIFLIIGIIYRQDEKRKFKTENKYVTIALVAITLVSPFVFYPVETAATTRYADEGHKVLQLDSLYANMKTEQIPTVDFRKGKHIVAFISLRCLHCRNAALKLATMYKRNPELPLYFILNGKKQYLDDFYEFSRSQNVPQSFLQGRNFVMLAGLELPRIILIKDGVEVQEISYPELDQELLEKWVASE